MLFDKLADFVLSRRRSLIVGWVAILLLSIPLMLQVDNVITYDENEYLGKSYESKVAQEVLQAEFPSTGTNSSVIMVLRGSDVASANARDFVLDLEQSIRSSISVPHLDKIVSIYDVYEQAIESVAIGLAPLINTLAEQTNLSNALEVASVESGIIDQGFLLSVYELGASPSQDALSTFAWSVVRNGTLDTYPVSLATGMSQSFINAENTAMLVFVTLTVEAASSQMGGGGSEAVVDVGALREIASRIEGEWNGQFSILCTGDAAILKDRRALFQEDMSLIGPATIALVLVLVSLFFRSVLSSFLPLGAIAIALGLSQAAVFIIGSYVVSVSSTVLTMLFVVLFGVGTDYTVFLLARYREELARGSSVENAMRTAITWAGESITTSGLAVVISVGVLSFSSFSMMRSMGTVVGVGIPIALLVALTFIPAIVLTRRSLFNRPSKVKNSLAAGPRLNRAEHSGYFRRAAKSSVSHPYVVLLAVLLVSLPAGYVFVTSKTSYDSIGALPDVESIEGIKAISRDFGAGLISPTFILIQFSEDLVASNGSFNNDLLRAIDDVSSALSEMAKVHELTSPTYLNGEHVPYEQLEALPLTEREALTADVVLDRTRQQDGRNQAHLRRRAIHEDLGKHRQRDPLDPCPDEGIGNNP